MFLKIKSILINLLGIKLYLKFVSKIYFIIYKIGLLKLFSGSFEEVNYLHKLIKPGWHCIDIGANLGYVTIPISNLCGKNGKVLAVEPVKLFSGLLKRHVKKYGNGNVEIYEYALGKDDDKKIEMGMPLIDGVLRHGFTKIVESSSKYPYAEKYDVKMKNPKSLFGDIDKLNFLKCDVEGYEINIIPEMIDLIKKFKPVILIEFGLQESRKILSDMFYQIGYELYRIENEELKKVTKEEMLTLTLNSYFLLPVS
ncbi:MAG TPA: FkbM family methyltransferase [Ignavibacteriaceae bacterium]|nr:FkbM family methyltransferase [Ignavibacteriaceae bacterium]